jgi:hypothetical protein
LILLNSTTGTDTRTECNTYTWIDGTVYTASNNTATFNMVGGAANGCDSLVTLDLTLFNSTTGTDIRTECNTYTWIDGIVYVADNNTATFNMVGGAANGCDSLVTLDLTLLNSTTGTDTRTECNSYTWIDGTVYTASNNTATFNMVGGAANGCDSLVTLDLTLLNSATGTETVTECNSYTWIDGNVYSSSNNTATFNMVGGAANGCDSIVTLDLTINGVSDLTTTVNGISITANNSVATYVWLDCESGYAVLPGETAQTFNPIVNGEYAIQLTENGCVDTTDCISIVSVGLISNSLANQFTVFPNPTTGQFTIDIINTIEDLNISLFALNGELIETRSFQNSSSVKFEVNEPAGMYILRISDNKEQSIVKITKE